jgi:hypothetical protein
MGISSMMIDDHSSQPEWKAGIRHRKEIIQSDSAKGEGGGLLFQRSQVSDHVANLAGIELELRHRWMPGDDAFGERFLKSFDRITLMQRAEGRRDPERAWADAIDRVASGTMSADEDEPSLCRWRERFFTFCHLWQQRRGDGKSRDPAAGAVSRTRQMSLRHDRFVSPT